MRAPEDVDVAVVGAGHNGLAATALVAKRGLRVLCLEKIDYVGGMAGTREILTGCRNDVGASLLFPLAKGVAEELELARAASVTWRPRTDARNVRFRRRSH